MRRIVAVLATGLTLGVVTACAEDASEPLASEVRPTTTVGGSTGAGREDLLLAASDLGDAYEQLTEDALSVPCTADVVGATQIAERSFISDPAQELIRQRVLEFNDANAASSAFEAALVGASCEPSDFDPAGGSPTALDVPGADRAFDVGYTDELDSASIAIALVDNFVVVIEVQLHQAGNGEALGSSEVIERAVTVLR